MTSDHDPAARHAVAERAYVSSFDGGAIWEPATKRDVTAACGRTGYERLSRGDVAEIQSFRGILYRRADGRVDVF